MSRARPAMIVCMSVEATFYLVGTRQGHYLLEPEYLLFVAFLLRTHLYVQLLVNRDRLILVSKVASLRLVAHLHQLNLAKLSGLLVHGSRVEWYRERAEC